MDIFNDYLQPDGKFAISIQRDVKRAIEQKFLRLNDNLDEYLFIELYAYVLD